MRFHRLPETLLTSPARVAVLKTLLRSRGREWSGRELAKASGVSAPQTMEALYLLYDEALVRQRRAGTPIPITEVVEDGEELQVLEVVSGG